MKILFINIILLFFSLTAWSQEKAKISIIGLNNDSDISLFVSANDIVRVSIDSNYITVRFKENIELKDILHSSNQVLLLFSFSCFCTVEVDLMHSNSSYRRQLPFTYYFDPLETSGEEDNDMVIVYGHLKTVEKDLKKILEFFKNKE